MELKFLNVNFFKIFRARVSNRIILISTCDNKVYVFVESAKFARLARFCHYAPCPSLIRALPACDPYPSLIRTCMPTRLTDH